ncbi:MAG: DUF2156 domain-containing protein [Candidatus Omnitrophica bacterium]|nr:DUF2156 domain-containing protein [Candidatus Omnitrophota bacterium]MBU1869361.1 DUF2156 domain-containing protein [Candidatus Omnitrophota bacterium]
MRLNKLSLKDKDIFNKYLGLQRHELSAYAFENIFLWKPHFEIKWAEMDGNLCVFFRDKIACFLYLSPLGNKRSPEAVSEAFKFMDSLNKNKDFSRIENVEEAEVDSYGVLGYECEEKYRDYLCKRSDLARLSGDGFKHKRACANFFIKHYKFEYSKFSPKHKEPCLKLFKSWMLERKEKNPDELYQAMLEDNQVCLNNLLDNYRDLGCVGRVIEVDGQVSAFTFGYPLSQDIFCILYEVTDLSMKGAAQFIFREFCRELSGYTYINIMDDSGLENLKRVKLSYKPIRTIPNYVVTRIKGSL